MGKKSANEEINLEFLINNAKAFHMAAKRCFEMRRLPDGKIESPLIPGIVNLAFSSELYFKYIIAREGEPQRGHKLSELFGQLNPATQNNVIAMTKYNKREFEKLINDHTNVFVDWRYIHDKNESKNVSIEFLEKLTNTVEYIADGYNEK